MSWFVKISRSEKDRIESNILRLEKLRSVVHDLGYFAIASNSGGYQALKELIDDPLVRGRPRVSAKLLSALLGENNQKIVLDGPIRFRGLMEEAESLVQMEINQEKKTLRALSVD